MNFMKSLHRYIIVSMLASYWICLGSAFLFYAILDLFSKFQQFVEYFDIMAKTGRSSDTLWGLIAKYYLYHAPFLFYQLTPLVTLMAAMFTITRMARANELILLKAGGVSMYRLFYPFMLFGLLAMLWMTLLQEYLIPDFAENMQEVEKVRYDRRAEIQNMQLCDSEKRIIYVGIYYPARRELRQIRVLIPAANPPFRAECEIEAASGQWLDIEGRHGIKLFQGRVYRYNEEGLLAKDEPISAAGYDVWTDIKDRDITFPSEKNLEMVSTWTLWKMRTEKARSATLETTFHSRLSFMVSNLILLLLGVPWILRSHTQNFFVGTAICTVAAGIFYGFYILCCNLGYKEILNPVFASWFAIAAFGSLGISFMTLIHT